MVTLFAIAGILAGLLVLGAIVFIWALGKAQQYDADSRNWRH